MKTLQAKFIEEIEKSTREGIPALIEFIISSDFFTAPASTRFHSSYPGGLVQHSWNVFYLMIFKARILQLRTPEDTLRICGLFHDIGKIGMYSEKEGGTYKVSTDLHIDHPEKSLLILQKYIPLSNEEMVAIRYHHAAFEVGLIGVQTPRAFSFQAALNKYPLISLMHASDLEATHLLEGS